MKTYVKENQVYTVQEGSELEIQLVNDDFIEVKEEAKPKKSSKKTVEKNDDPEKDDGGE
ncbi:hypothetical protein ABNB56_07230 [Streptococcus iniae]|uniref:hypothetical protein n=1 Tax=Streptococcus iniae TaxID=1346 RepID=UPI00160547D6|nr:hypothetical protein [Streptococcus iniae]